MQCDECGKKFHGSGLNATLEGNQKTLCADCYGKIKEEYKKKKNCEDCNHFDDDSCKVTGSKLEPIAIGINAFFTEAEKCTYFTDEEIESKEKTVENLEKAGRYEEVAQECERLGMPLVVWAYPRGRDVEAKGGKGTLYAQDYAARVAEELGADVVKLHEPMEDPGASPEPYRSLREDGPARLRRIVRSAGRVMVLFSGGIKQDDDAAVLRKVKRYMDCGATGVMFGRNMWLRDFESALALTRRVHAILARCPR